MVIDTRPGATDRALPNIRKLAPIMLTAAAVAGALLEVPAAAAKISLPQASKTSGATRTIEPNQLIGPGTANFSASVPKIAVDPRNPQRIVVVWRALSMDPQTIGMPDASRQMICHMSLSRDGGAHFQDQAIDWGITDTLKCNAPFVDIGKDGTIFLGATLAGDLPQNAPKGTHPKGRVVVRLSHDGGATWSMTRSILSGDAEEPFMHDPSVPPLAEKVPWDGARGVIDHASGRLFVAGGFPAPPGEDLKSQRFYRSSSDGGRSWGLIRPFGSTAWPERWDGHIIAAHGKLALAYLADRTPIAAAHCLCVVFATGLGDASHLSRHLVAEVSDVDTLVHYPPIAADPSRSNHYALALVERGKPEPQLLLTRDEGTHWHSAGTIAPATDTVRASRPALVYTPDGVLVAVWRTYHANGNYDTYATASADGGGQFGPTLRVSSEESRIPETLLRDYAVRGDFLNVAAASRTEVHIAWTDWRSGVQGQVYYARIPIARLIDTVGSKTAR